MSRSSERKNFGNDLGTVRSCRCGGVKLNMGPITLHFAPDEVLALYELVSVAKNGIESEEFTRDAADTGRGALKSGNKLH